MARCKQGTQIQMQHQSDDNRTSESMSTELDLTRIVFDITYNLCLVGR